MKIIRSGLPMAAAALVSISLASSSWAATKFQRFENKAHGLWLQATDVSDGTGEGQNIQAVPTNFTGDKTRWFLIPIDGDPGYYRLENKAYGLWIQCSNTPDASQGQPDASNDADTLAIRAVDKSYTGQLTRWKKIQQNDGYYFLQNKETEYFLQATTLTDLDSDGFDNGQQVRAVPSYKTGDWTRFKDVDAGSEGNLFSQRIEAENFTAASPATIVTANDVDGGNSVRDIAQGEWLAYGSVMSIPTSGKYKIEYRVASPNGGVLAADLFAGSTPLGQIQIPATGGFNSWTTVHHVVDLPAGAIDFGVNAASPDWAINWFRISNDTGDASGSSGGSSSSSSGGSGSSSSGGSSGGTGNITPLYNANTSKQPEITFDRGDALVTRFSDRPRTRHAREDQFQSYDHYIKFYFEHRSTNIEIVDRVAKGGDSITMNVRTLWPLDDLEAENRWWYIGRNTVAHYVGNGIMNFIGTTQENGTTYYNYRKTDNVNRQFNREIRIGDRLEFEISQFSRSDIPRGQANYYGTTFLYKVGEGIVPWYTENAGEFVEGRADFQEDSRKIPEEYWLGGKTTLHYQYTNEPNDHFMQMATNLGYDNGQKFLLGRRIHHSSAVNGTHDEDAENGVHPIMNGKAGSRWINQRCTSCHERNGAAKVAPVGELLDRWVFKVGDANGNPHADLGRVLQPKGNGEGGVSIQSWTQNADGLRKPNYAFNNIRPPRFSARIAPRLVGLGLLEAIPESTVLGWADPDDANGDGISGRVNRIADANNGSITRLGRFGWKAGTYSVRHQAAVALLNDMGVRSNMMPNPDCGANQSGTCGGNSPIVPNGTVDNLVTYLTTLGVRPQRGIKSGTVNQQIKSGKQIFADIGCTGCHKRNVQTSAFHPFAEVRNQTIHPYTDLLLHDMGPGLADNLGEGDASGSEWRTAPLWGLGLQACVTGGVTNPSGREGGEVCTPHRGFLHDGRARNLDEAIRWHGGEGQAANNRYQNLSNNARNDLLEFLRAL